jgi:rhodanese-related sulfurtransferase
METITLVVAGLALVVALAAYLRAGRGAGRAAGSADDNSREVRRVTGVLERELRSELDVTRRLLAEMARGVQLSPEAIMEGQLWRDIDGVAAVALVSAGGVTLVDVRTPTETVTGVLPGAKLIPMDELDQRRHEIPKDGRVLLYCAMGGRSAAACDVLAREGWSGLMNLTGGIGAWKGPVVKP